MLPRVVVHMDGLQLQMPPHAERILADAGSNGMEREDLAEFIASVLVLLAICLCTIPCKPLDFEKTLLELSQNQSALFVLTHFKHFSHEEYSECSVATQTLSDLALLTSIVR
jgi:hypothetical protein